MNNSTESYEYCDLETFSKSYQQVHGYLSIFVCVFGSIANILNIIVLSTKEMRVPTNFILTWLAVADLMVMLEYIPFSVHVYFLRNTRKPVDYFSYNAALFMYFHALFTQIGHFISCCLTVTLAVWRYLAIVKPQNSIVWCNHQRTKLAVILSYLLCLLICTPLFFGLEIQTSLRHAFPNGTLIPNKINFDENYTNATLYYMNYNERYSSINFWLYSVIIKLVPCILLTVLSVRLIMALLDAKKRYRNLVKNRNPLLLARSNKSKSKKNYDKEQQADRTTRMLLAVLLLFLMTEFPQAIFGLLISILGKDFDKYCYRPLGDLMDIFALTNSAINFILYCSMSQQFRKVFKTIFIKPIFKYPERKTNYTDMEKTAVTML